MGYDTSNILPKETKEKDVKEFLKLLGYYGQGSVYAFYKDEDYKFFEGVVLFITREDNNINNPLQIDTHTSIWSSDYDIDFQNYTVNHLKKEFGGTFITDFGKSRYLKVHKPKRFGAQNGCYFAFFRLHNQFVEAKMLLSKIEENEWGKDNYGLNINHVSLATNIITTYISSIIENYFRDIYVALLKYSDKKDKVFKNAKITSDDMLDICSGKINMEQAIAYSKSFQNIHKIHANFKELAPKIDIYGTLSKPFHRRKETLFQTVNRVLEHRHGVVHRLELDIKYDKDSALKDIDSVNKSLELIYYHICEIYNWESR